MIQLHLDIPLGALNRLVGFTSGILGEDVADFEVATPYTWNVGLVEVRGVELLYKDLVKRGCEEVCRERRGFGFSLTRMIFRENGDVWIPLEGGVQELRECKESLVRQLPELVPCEVTPVEEEGILLGRMKEGKAREVRFKRPISWTAQTLWIVMMSEELGPRRLYRLFFGGR